MDGLTLALPDIDGDTDALMLIDGLTDALLLIEGLTEADWEILRDWLMLGLTLALWLIDSDAPPSCK